MTTVSNKRPPPIVRPARNGMFDKKGDGTIVTENLAGANPGQVSRIVYPTISTKCLQALTLTVNTNIARGTTDPGCRVYKGAVSISGAAKILALPEM